MSDCAKWLRKYLAPGMAECTEVRLDAFAAGFTRAELKAARRELGVKTWHQADMDGWPRIANWFWFLPEARV